MEKSAENHILFFIKTVKLHFYTSDGTVMNTELPLG